MLKLILINLLKQQVLDYLRCKILKDSAAATFETKVRVLVRQAKTFLLLG